MTSLRDSINAAIHHHEANPGGGVALPSNANQMGRPPRTLDLADPEVAAALSNPGFVARLKDARRSQDPSERAAAQELLTDLRQFARAERGERALPGEYMGDPSQPYLPLPYAARDEHRPDRQPGTHNHRVMRSAMDQLDAEDITQGLARKMGTHDANAAIEAREDAAEPSLRERVAAAVAVHNPD